VHLFHHYISHTIEEEFNVDSKVECDQFNLTHVARKKKYKKESERNKQQSEEFSIQ